jgi:signal transduction histidine kinase
VTKWGADVTGRLASARTTRDVAGDSQDANRLLVPLLIDGRRNGVFWALANDGLDEEDRQALIVVGQCLSRHPALVERLGLPNDQARIAQRLQDAAVVAAKIAHDFDNIFTGVVGFAEIALSMVEPGSLPHQYIKEINSAGNRGTQFTQQLHALSRSGASRPMPTTVSSVLAREETRIRKTVQALRFQFVVPTDLPAVALDAGALQSIMATLLENAVEASPPSGLVRVTASLVELSDAESREFLGAATAGPFVEICVGDEGPGIRDDHRQRMFVEPFFTTKVRHRGLGLPVVYRILHAHRGGIRFDTAPGRGTVFQMVLPLAGARNSERGAGQLENTRSQEAPQHESGRR